jgi:hypothetical protein
MSDAGAHETSKHMTNVLRLCGLIAGFAMLVIGARFLLVPGSAAKFFGVGALPTGHQLHFAVGLRDLWVGALALAFAWTRQWFALALWFGLGALVCFGDALIVALQGDRPSAVTFHAVSGVLCVGLGAAIWRHVRATKLPMPGGGT